MYHTVVYQDVEADGQGGGSQILWQEQILTPIQHINREEETVAYLLESKRVMIK